MSNLTNGNNFNENTFGQDVLNMVKNRAVPVGISEWSDRMVTLNVTPTIKWVAEALETLLVVKGIPVAVTDSTIETFLTNLVKLRVMQVNNRLPKGVVSGEVPVPDFFRPVLAKIVKFETPMRALTIGIEWGELELRDGAYLKADGGQSSLEIDYDAFVKTARVLKASGIRFTNGLPRGFVTDDDSCFRICESSDGELLVAGADVTEVDLLVRSIVRMSFLRDVYGAARTRYVSVEGLRAAWEAIASTAIS